MRSIRWRTASSPSNRPSGTLSIRPFRSTYTSSGPFTITSVTSGSLSRDSIGPNPTTSSETSLTTRASSRARRMSRSPAAAAAPPRRPAPGVRSVAMRRAPVHRRVPQLMRSCRRTSARTSDSCRRLPTSSQPGGQTIEGAADPPLRGEQPPCRLDSPDRTIDGHHRDRVCPEHASHVARRDLASACSVHDEPAALREAENRDPSSARSAARNDSASNVSTCNTRSASRNTAMATSSSAFARCTTTTSAAEAALRSGGEVIAGHADAGVGRGQHSETCRVGPRGSSICASAADPPSAAGRRPCEDRRGERRRRSGGRRRPGRHRPADIEPSAPPPPQGG